MKEEEVIPRILAMEGRRGRPPNSERQLMGDNAKGSRRRKGRPPNVGNPLVPEGPTPSEVKLLRKLEAQGRCSNMIGDRLLISCVLPMKRLQYKCF